jgi:hypothetical protein
MKLERVKPRVLVMELPGGGRDEELEELEDGVRSARKLADFDEDDAAEGVFDWRPRFWSESPV